MINNTIPPSPKLILRGIHLSLTEAMERAFQEKAERLFRHDSRILRVRVDLEQERSTVPRLFEAKGHVEVAGPDLRASVRSEDAYKAVNLLIDKLERMLRKRSTAAGRSRSADDVRNHPVAV